MKKYIMSVALILILNGCGEDGGGDSSVDITEYLPSDSFEKVYTDVSKSNGEFKDKTYMENILVEPNMIKIKREDVLKSIITISSDDVKFLSVNELNSSNSYKRNIYIGDKVSNYIAVDERKKLTIDSQIIGEKHTKVIESCVFENKLNIYTFDYSPHKNRTISYKYENHDGRHDILKLKCTSIETVNTLIYSEYNNTVTKDNISYKYLQKGLGVIATVDNDCIVDIKGNIVDDKVNKEQCIGEQYHHILYHTEY